MRCDYHFNLEYQGRWSCDSLPQARAVEDAPRTSMSARNPCALKTAPDCHSRIQ